MYQYKIVGTKHESKYVANTKPKAIELFDNDYPTERIVSVERLPHKNCHCRQ